MSFFFLLSKNRAIVNVMYTRSFVHGLAVTLHKVDTLVDHFGHPECPNKFTSKTKFDEAHTIEDVRSKIEHAQPSDELAKYKPFIEIFDPEVSDYVLLNQDYLNSSRPFSKKNTPSGQEFSLDTEVDYKRQLVRLRVRWNLKDKHYLVSTTAVSSKLNCSHFKMSMIVYVS